MVVPFVRDGRFPDLVKSSDITLPMALRDIDLAIATVQAEVPSIATTYEACEIAAQLRERAVLLLATESVYLDRADRLSGGNGAGGNPQNLRRCKDPEGHAAGHDCPARMRKGITAPAGRSLVVGDFSQVEPRVLAWLAGDRDLQAAFASGDPYCAFGTRFYGRIITKKDKAERDFSKVGVIAPGYGMGWKKLIKKAKIDLDIDLPEDKARATIDFYRSTYGCVPALWKYLENLLPLMADGQKGHLYTLPAVKWDKEGFILPSGLRIRYPNLRQREVVKDGKPRMTWGYTAYRQKRADPDFVPIWGSLMTENLCQALAGEIGKHSMRLVGLGSLFGQIHDELIAVVPEASAEVARRSLEVAMTMPPPWFPGIVLGAEVHCGPNWLEAKA